ncbi:MAG TPA: BON domain-containing protein [Vicinamibacterales bacterium]|nr:BON domain-containing protein [Vicinamibacterales bacterium]
MKKLSILPAAFLALAIGTSACMTENDPSDRVEQALEQANVEGVNVDYDRDARVVHLKGQVQSADEKQRAEEVATTAVGTSGTVLNELMVEGTDEDRVESADDLLKTRLNDTIQAHPQLSAQTIDFYVNNGVVTVTGEVQTAAQKTEVGRIVKETPGVEDFANELRVANENKPRR